MEVILPWHNLLKVPEGLQELTHMKAVDYGVYCAIDVETKVAVIIYINLI